MKWLGRKKPNTHVDTISPTVRGYCDAVSSGDRSRIDLAVSRIVSQCAVAPDEVFADLYQARAILSSGHWRDLLDREDLPGPVVLAGALCVPVGDLGKIIAHRSAGAESMAMARARIERFRMAEEQRVADQRGTDDSRDDDSAGGDEECCGRSGDYACLGPRPA
jgi:hypothetical protein